MPHAEPCPDRPPLHLTGGFLAIASPTRLEEACFAAPAVRALKHARPHGTLVMLCPEKMAPLWRIMPEVDQVLPYGDNTSSRQLARVLIDCGLTFDSAILWEKNTAALAIYKAGIRQRLGFPIKELQKLITDPVPVINKPGPIEHRVRHYLLFVEKLAVKAFQATNFVPPERPPAPVRPRLALAPDSDFGSSATWSQENFEEVLTLLIGKNEHDIRLIVPLDGPDTAARALSEKYQLPLVGDDGDLAKTLSFLATCDHLIANDGTLPHLAAHVGTPTLTIFGPNEPGWKRPLGKIHRILREHVPCSPCFLNACPLDHRCLKVITPTQVLAEFAEM